MLRSLHVKNLALIRETEVEFGEGLNIPVSYTHLTLPTIYSV